MDGGIAGPGPASLQDSLPRSGVPSAQRTAVSAHPALGGLVVVQVATSLLSLADAHIDRLIEELEPTRLTADPAALDRLLQTAIAAANTRDLPAAMSAITDLIALNPERGPQLVRDATALDAIRP